MRSTVIIDDNGDTWPIGAPRLRDVLMCSGTDSDIATYAVRNLGFVLVRWLGHMARVEMRPGLVRPPTLIGLYYNMLDLQPEQILLSRLDAKGASYELFSDVAEFTATIGHDIGDDVTASYRHVYDLTPRPLENLKRARYARFQPILDLWRASRGRMPDDLLTVLGRTGIRHRALLARHLSGTGRLIYEHCGSGFSFLRDACWPLLLIGQDIEMLPDSDYGAWATRSYHECIADKKPRLQTVSAIIRPTSGQPHWTYYDRMLLPWRSGDGTQYVLGVSELRRRLRAA